MKTALPVLNGATLPGFSEAAFDTKLAAHGRTLIAGDVETLQVNLGKLCNQACKHCHVDAAPNRTEIMTRATAVQVIAALRRFRIPIIDITGGAPELNPSFRYLLDEAHQLGVHTIVRHNLTVMFEPGQEDLPQVFRDHRVEVVSSLPYFLESQTDAQRGGGVFEKSITALQRLNAVGYGVAGSNLILNLVYNPVGAYLPPSQEEITRDFKRELATRYGVSFNQLFTITNMPIKRFLDYLQRSGNLERYMRKLLDAFNPGTVEGLMCRTLVSVDWTGRLFDCDFNQMIELGVAPGLPRTIAEFDPQHFRQRRIMTGLHCFGCTAGAGSSCGGAVAS
jgi:radical SAM/Cys-rich protein